MGELKGAREVRKTRSKTALGYLARHPSVLVDACDEGTDLRLMRAVTEECAPLRRRAATKGPL